jgi:hypothetical protein
MIEHDLLGQLAHAGADLVLRDQDPFNVAKHEWEYSIRIWNLNHPAP